MFCDMPYRSPEVMTKVKGKNIPQKKQKAAATVKTNLMSCNGRIKFMGSNPFFCGFNLDFRVRLAMTSIKRMRNAQIRIAQPNWTCGISFDTMIGKITPPRLDPEAVIPSANARRLANQPLTELIEALNIALAPSGLHIP